MTHDHSTDEHEHDGHDHAHDDHGHDDHAHGGHDDHGHEQDDASSDASTLVPTSRRQLIFPALILLLVGILLIGPVTGAFAPRPAPATTEEVHSEGGETGGVAGEPTHVEVVATATTAPARPSATTVPVESTSTPVAAAPGLSAEAIATRTAVAVAGQQGDVTRAPQQLQFAGAQFAVIAGGEVLPDWKTTADEGKAVWITGTYANHVIYLPFSDTNAALFASARQGDTVSLVMDTGQTFEFEVTRSERAYNGPPTSDGQFTTATAMNQDHAGVTLFLVGEPASDRAVVQADFTGNIQ
ncbi:MAG: hypothetical protein WCD37_17255 [Chloroflexia bacterium]